MKLTGHALTEDAVDRYNHSWGVVLLLTISASTWLLPQLSYFQQAAGKDVAMNRYVANCWCPKDFTSNQIAYIHAACAKAFGRALRNVDEFSNETTTTARVYSTVSPRVSKGDNIFRPSSTEETRKPNHFSQPAMTRIYSRIPVVTFVLAVCLLLPYIFWALLSSFSEAGLSQVLRSLKDAQCTGAEVRNEEIIQAISSKHTRSSSTVMYLFFKLLTIAVPVAGLCYVKSELVSWPMVDYSNTMLFCKLPIAETLPVNHYMVQCVFTAESDSMFLRLYDSLHIILAFFFALLVTVNILNFIGWVIKLSPGPFRNGTFSNSKLALDDYLLLYMARQNVGFLAASNLERGFSSRFLAGRNRTFSGDTETGHELRPLT